MRATSKRTGYVSRAFNYLKLDKREIVLPIIRVNDLPVSQSSCMLLSQGTAKRAINNCEFYLFIFFFISFFFISACVNTTLSEF